MYRKIFSKALSLALILGFIFSAVVHANVDRFILNDPVLNTYTGRPNIGPLITGLSFNDLPASLTQRDAIVRGGALGVFMPEGGDFNPDIPITRAQAMRYAIRAAGFSEEARARTNLVAEELPEDAPLDLVWTFAYMQQARDMGLITEAEYFDAVESLTPPPAQEEDDDDVPPFLMPGEEPPEPTPPPPRAPVPLAFYLAPVTREEAAFYVYTAFEYADSGIFDGPPNQPGQSVFPFTDWATITPGRAAAVEAMIRYGGMVGQTATVFGPHNAFTRAQMAQVIRNLDALHFQLLELERMTGTVSEIVQEQFIDTVTGQSWHQVYIRRADGRVDVLQSTARFSPSPQDGPLDTVVLRNGQVMGLNGLQMGDPIEYIVHPETNTVWYVRVLGEMAMQEFVGRLQAIHITERTMTFTDPNGRSFTFPMIQGLSGTGTDGVPYVRFNNIMRPVDTIPLGSFYRIMLVNNLVTEIEFIGDPVLYREVRGIVTEINSNLGFLTIIDENRSERTFNFIPGTIQVQRRDFYDMRESGWNVPEPLHLISDVVAGDIVSLRLDAVNPARITHLSAAAQTATRYGRIREFRPRGGYYEMLMEFENGQTAWFTIVERVLVLERGVPVSPNRIQVGDWAQLRVNQALLGPGIMMESVLEVVLDSGSHHISRVVMGQLSRFAAAQNQLHIAHAQEMTPAGWSNHQPLAQFAIGGANVQYFFDGQPVTLSYLSRYLQRGSGTVYMALENNFAGERVTMVSVRSGRDELLRPETVMASAGNTFNLLGVPGTIATDPGTIVVRNGRLVDPGNIAAPDWARVALNGHNLAAVVDISQPPSIDGLQLVRGRVQRVWPHQSFRVETMSSFDGLRWNYTPIAREFTIDYDTLFMMEGGIGSINDFIGYTEDSVIGQVFNVVVDGGRAVWVIDMPFTEPIPSMPNAPGHLMLRGTIFDVGGGVRLRDVTVYNPRTSTWRPISLVDASADVTFGENALILDRDQVVSMNRLQNGQQVRILTNTPLNEVAIGGGMEAEGFIIIVES